MSFYKSVVVTFLVGILITPVTEAGGLGKAFVRSAIKKVLKKDLARDARTVAKPLVKQRQVWRYTSHKQAAHEAAHGVAPGSHMTAGTTPGRPPSTATAQARYGLPKKPQVRTTWRLPSGTPVRSNKALGGAPGVGEMTSVKHVPPEHLVRTIPLRSSKK